MRDALVAVGKWVSDIFGLQPGELGDAYAALSLIGSAIGFVLAVIVWAIK